jgi:protein-tyrosine-phosphatase
MAEAFLNQMAHIRHLNIKGLSAGTVSGKDLNPMAIQAMAEIGIPLHNQTPKLITQDLIQQSDKIISMGCGVDADACPAKFILTEDWNLDDPAGQPIEKVRDIRDQIQTRVSALLDELSK